MLDTSIFNIAPNKVPTRPEDYSTFIYGPPKIGKTTLAYDMFKQRGLFIATEDRHKALPGAMIIRVKSWVDYLTVMGQLRQPQAKELYDTIIVDTAENLYGMLEKYVAAKWKEKTVGERDDLWGKDWTDLRIMWKDGLMMISDAGFVPVFISHATQNTVQIPASGVLDSDLAGSTVEKKTVKDKKSGTESEVYEFLKYQPDLKDKVMGPINKMVDNILFVNTTLNTTTNEEQRVIYLRDTLQWQAGSTFEGIDPIIPLSAAAYRSAVQRAIAKIDKDQTTDVSTRHKETEEIVFADVMKEVTEYAKGFHAAKQMEEITQISNDVFGLGNKITQATEDQAELLVSALEKIKDKALKLGITIQ